MHFATRQGYVLVGPPRGVTTTMYRYTQRQHLSRVRLIAERVFASLERFMHIEAASGIVLLVAAAVALIWANSPLAHGYHSLWHVPLTVGIGDFVFSRSLHFWVNDALMAVFFLAVGMEIRCEIHQGALRDLKQASLPIMAAVGGVAVPALIYLGMNADSTLRRGWAIPTATDIAFAMGALALLGRLIPANVRVFLLALAIIDDIIAVLIIALFYSGGLDYHGFAVAAVGLLMVLGLQQIGIGSAYAYVLPGAITWSGLLMTGAHPTLAGVMLGMMTPVVPLHARESPLDMVARVAKALTGRDGHVGKDASSLAFPLKQLQRAQRDLLPPAVRVQKVLHPWVAYGIMPLFALANAGISFGGIDLSKAESQWVVVSVTLALVAGKPLGVIGMSWLVIRLGWCHLPFGVSWRGIILVGLLAGIGFTMSIFITMLAFDDEALLGAAKLGVLVGSLIAAVLGLGWGMAYRRSCKGVDLAHQG